MTEGEPGASGGADASAGRRQAELPRAASPADLAGFGFQFIISILICLYAGRWLDTRLGTSPLLLVLGVFVGAGGSFYSMYRRVTAGQRGPRGGKPSGGR